MSGEKSRIFYLSPHKGFDRIFREYGVEGRVTPDVLERWAGIASGIWLQLREFEENALERLIEEAAKLGKSLGVAEERLPAFTKDIIRTTLFYLRAAEIIGEITEEDEEG